VLNATIFQIDTVQDNRADRNDPHCETNLIALGIRYSEQRCAEILMCNNCFNRLYRPIVQNATMFHIDVVQDNLAERNDSECEATGYNELYKTIVLNATSFQIDTVQDNRAERNDFSSLSC
jgi:hypothetical protein